MIRNAVLVFTDTVKYYVYNLESSLNPAGRPIYENNFKMGMWQQGRVKKVEKENFIDFYSRSVNDNDSKLYSAQTTQMEKQY